MKTWECRSAARSLLSHCKNHGFESHHSYDTMKTCKSEGCTAILDPKKVRGNYCTPCRGSSQRYGLTAPQREKILADQGGRCKLCARSIVFDGTTKYTSACVDHDHLTKKVRGILCQSCNTWLGYFENNKLDLNVINNYLRNFGT